MLKKHLLLTIFPFQIALSTRFETTLTLEILYCTFRIIPEGKTIPTFDKKPLIDGKAKFYDTFTPTLQCFYDKNTQKFASNELKVVLTLYTEKRETVLGKFPVELTKIMKKKEKLRFDLSNGTDQNSYVELGMRARFSDGESTFESSISPNIYERSNLFQRAYESNDFNERNVKRHLSYDRFLHNPQTKIQRLLEKEGSLNMSSRSKYGIDSPRRPLNERFSEYADSKRNLNKANGSQYERQKQNLRNQNADLKRKCRQLQYDLDSMKSKQKGFEAEVEREKRKQMSKSMMVEEQAARLNLKLNEKQNEIKRFKAEVQKKAAEHGQMMRQSQRMATETTKKYESEMSKMNKRLQKSQEKLQQSLKNVANLESKLNNLVKESKQNKISYEEKCLQLSQSKQETKKILSRIQNFQLQRVYLEQQIRELQQDRSELILEYKLLAEQNISLKKQIQSHASELMERKQLVEDYKQKLGQLEQEFWEIRKENQEKQRELQDWKQKNIKLQKQLEKRNKLIEQLTEMNSKGDTKMKQIIKQMKSNNEDKEKEIFSYRQALKKKQEKIQALLKENIVKANNIEKKDKENQELNAQLQAKNMAIGCLEEEIFKLKDENSQQTALKQALQERCQMLANDLKQANQNFDQTKQKFQKSIETKQAQIQQLEQQLIQLNEQILNLKQNLQDLKTQNQQFMSTLIPEYEKKIQQLQEVQIQRYKGLIKQQMQKISSKNQQLLTSQEKINQLKRQLQQTNIENQKLLNLIENKQKDYELLEQSKLEMNHRYETLMKNSQIENVKIIQEMQQKLKSNQNQIYLLSELISGILNQLLNFSDQFCSHLQLTHSLPPNGFESLKNWKNIFHQSEPLQTNLETLKSLNQLVQLLEFQLKTHINSQNEKTQALTQQTEESQRQNEELTQLISELNQQLFQYHKTNQKLSNQLQNMQHQLARFQQHAQSIAQQLGAAQTAKMSSQSTVQTLKTLEEQLQNTLKAKNESLAFQQKIIDELKTKINDQTNSYDSLQFELTSKNHQLSQNILHLKSELQSTSNELQNFKSQNITLATINFQLHITQKSLQTNLKSAKQENQTLSEQLTFSQKSFKTLETSSQSKIQQIQNQKEKLMTQISELEKKFKSSELQKKSKLNRLNLNLDTLTKENDACLQQLKSDKNTLLKIQQSMIQVDKMILNLEKDNKISSAFAIPLKNILKKNQGLININLKSISALTVISKITSPGSKAPNIEGQSKLGKNDETKKGESRKLVREQGKNLLRKADEKSSSSRNEGKGKDLDGGKSQGTEKSYNLNEGTL